MKLQELWFDAYETWVFTHISHGEFTGWLIFEVLPCLIVTGLVGWWVWWMLKP
jgi:hypothetical protein